MEFSEEQRLIIDAPIDNILVSAAAGSGKTTVLVERIITKLIKGEFNLDELLVVTFTNEAADNMRRKISSVLSRRIKELKTAHPENKELIRKLKLQLDKLPNAYIQTLNSFCARVIKEKGYVYSDKGTSELLEPGIPILDENTLEIILTDAIGAALSSIYDEMGHGKLDREAQEDMLLLVRMFGDGRSDDALGDALKATFKKLRSIPNYLEYIEELYVERVRIAEAYEIYGLQTILDEVLDCCRKAYNNLDELASLVDAVQFVSDRKKNAQYKDNWIQLLDDSKLMLSGILAVGDSSRSTQEQIYKSFFEYKSETMILQPPIPVCERKGKIINDEEPVSRFEELFAPLCAFMFLRSKVMGYYSKRGNGYGNCALLTDFPIEYCSFFTNDFGNLLDYQIVRNRQLHAFIELLRRIDSAYKLMKKQIHGMDFSDQEHIAYAILSDKDNSDARDYYREKFTEIYIDEYQDNSRLQDAIIDLFARHCSTKDETDDSDEGRFGNVFRVGDVKQSIYKFRYASPQLFNDKLNSYSKGQGGVLYFLNRNFRSDSTIIDFVNLVFEQIMCAESGTEITYDESQRLIYNEGFEHKYSSVVPNVVFCKPGTIDSPRDLRDCSKPKYVLRQGVLSEVKRYIDEGFGYKDICILTRSNKMALVVSNYLNSKGFPSKVVENRKLFDDNDIKGIANLIILIANQYRDEYLLGVMLSNYRFSNFTLDEVTEIITYANRTNRNLYLIDKLRLFAGEEYEELNDRNLQSRVNQFLDSLNRLKLQNIITDIGILIENIYKETGIVATLTSDENGEEGKLLLFKDYLCKNYLSMGSNIAGVARYLEEMQIKLAAGVTMQIDDTSDNKIRCMTCHSSKGLEFPCVIVTELDSAGNKDSDSAIEFDQDFGFAVKDYKFDDYSANPSLDELILKRKRKLAAQAEDIRLLYVALTRAQYRLSVVMEVGSNVVNLRQCAFLQNTYVMDRKLHELLKPGMGAPFLAALIRTFAVDSTLRIPFEYNHLIKRFNVEESNLFTCRFMVPDEIFYDWPELASTLNPDENHASEDFDADWDENEEEDNVDNSSKALSQDEDSVYFEEELKTSASKIELNCSSFDDTGFPIFEPYSHNEAIDIPFKISVSQLKQEYEIENNVSMNLELPSLEKVLDERTEEASTPLSSSEIGTFVHSIMRYINLGLLQKQPEAFEAEIERLQTKGIILTYQMPLVGEFKSAILNFAQSDLVSMMSKAMQRGQLYKEKPIVFSMPVLDNSEDDFALVQGVIDTFFVDDDGQVILLDYKTDNLKKFESDEAKKAEATRRHKVQLDLYAAALESSGMKVKSKILCLLRHNLWIEV